MSHQWLGDKWWTDLGRVKKFDERFVRGAADECWLWTGPKSSKGYGILNERHRSYLAHRLALERELGYSLESLWALHSCDNPPCVNPAHLRAGDAADNMRDRAERGRMNSYQKGERNGAAKLTAAQVLEIKALLARSDLYQWQIAQRFGVKQPTISEIKNGRHWRVLS